MFGLRPSNSFPQPLDRSSSLHVLSSVYRGWNWRPSGRRTVHHAARAPSQGFWCGEGVCVRPSTPSSSGCRPEGPEEKLSRKRRGNVVAPGQEHILLRKSHRKYPSLL